jgi:uncharacterized protein (TIGR02231 family)
LKETSVPEVIEVEAPITAVTVFRDGARVVRNGAFTAGPGTVRAVIGGLPSDTDAASIRVALRGHAVTLVDIEVRREYAAEPLRADTGRLRDEVQACRDAVAALDDEDAAQQAALTFSGHLSQQAATSLARAMSFGRAGHEDLDQMAGHLSASTASALARRREIAARRRDAQRELQAAEQRLADAEVPAAAVRYLEVAAIVQASAQAEAELELSYHVSGVSWRPLYDLGLTGEVLTLGYLAEITQRTGEDWPEVDLAVSTARQGQHQTLPELRPWYVSRLRPPRPPAMPPAMPPVGARASRFGPEITLEPPAPGGAPAGAMASAPSAPYLPPPPAPPLSAGVDEAGAGLVYRIPRPLAVPADGSPHKTSIASLELDAKLDHLAVPVLATEAYLRATVTNNSRLLLLPGQARIFHEGQFTGETELETVASGEEFELQLGVDDQIRVERELRRRAASKAVLGGTRTIDVGYEITVENHRQGKARISVKDHIPVSADGEIKVKLKEATPSPAERTDLGELTWHLELDQGESAAITYRFTVEHPASVTLAGI